METCASEREKTSGKGGYVGSACHSGVENWTCVEGLPTCAGVAAARSGRTFDGREHDRDHGVAADRDDGTAGRGWFRMRPGDPRGPAAAACTQTGPRDSPACETLSASGSRPEGKGKDRIGLE